MSIPATLLVIHKNGSITNESFFTVSYSYSEKIESREGVLSILKQNLAEPIPDSYKERSKWRETAQKIKLFGFVFDLSEFPNMQKQ